VEPCPELAESDDTALLGFDDDSPLEDIRTSPTAANYEKALQILSLVDQESTFANEVNKQHLLSIPSPPCPVQSRAVLLKSCLFVLSAFRSPSPSPRLSTKVSVNGQARVFNPGRTMTHRTFLHALFLSAVAHMAVVFLFPNPVVAADRDFTEHLINAGGSNGPLGVYLGDLDNDTDVDVLSIAGFGFKNLIWFENLAAAPDSNVGGFSETAHEIPSGLDETHDAFLGDLDQDGDVDVLTASGLNVDEDGAAWYENLSAAPDSQLGVFGREHLLGTGVGSAKGVSAADLDGDGDLDALVAHHRGVVWYENLSAAPELAPGTFGPPITLSAVKALDIFAGDFDDDGDLDVMWVTSGETISWSRNQMAEPDSAPKTFAPAEAVTTPSEGGWLAVPVDLDLDGDLDLVLASDEDAAVSWIENMTISDTPSPGVFGHREDIAMLTDPRGLVAVDLDGDDDLDLVAASNEDTITTSGESKIVWYENLAAPGLFPTFAEAKVITENLSEPRRIVAMDVDEDGDVDILGTSHGNDRVFWYENHDPCVPACVNGDCRNTADGPICDCEGTGYQGPTCSEDVDECATSSHDCDENADCTNEIGSYVCQCRVGYYGSGSYCYDVDECAKGINDCDVNATCSNVPGAFDCACNDGFEGDGRSCVAAPEPEDTSADITVTVPTEGDTGDVTPSDGSSDSGCGCTLTESSPALEGSALLWACALLAWVAVRRRGC